MFNSEIRIFALSLILACACPIFGQNYRYPLDRQISMSANFGELRSQHFHSGIDLRVGGVIGANIYAVEEGFVSRISVSPTGYGKALYIDHPDGRTTVYGHLDRFAGAIARYTKDYQYKAMQFSVNLYPEPDALPVKKGDLIGYAGNSGSSFGAHLHFEIRMSEKQTPLNPIKEKYFAIKDSVAPKFLRAAIFTFDDINDTKFPRILASEKAIGVGNNYTPEKTKVFEVRNPVYIGIQADDYQPANTSKQGINVMKAWLDNEPFFEYTMDMFDFEDTRYINSLIDYGELKAKGIRYIKTYVEPGNKLNGVYSNVKNNGLITLNDTLPHDVRIEIFDDSGNKSVMNFKIRKSDKVQVKRIIIDTDNYLTIRWDEPFDYSSDELKVSIPEGALYDNTVFNVMKNATYKGYSPLWTIGNPNVPIHKNINISIKHDVPPALSDKAVIVRQNDKGGISYCGGKPENDYITADVREFGNYFVTTDTVPPVISLRQTSKKDKTEAGDFRNRNKLGVIISDNLSGISKYNGYIDDKWMLFEYDAKNNLLEYTFDNDIERGKTHTLKVVVTDRCNNTETFVTEILR